MRNIIMSVNALNASISAARADGNITAEEAKTLTSPEVLGAYTDKDEFQALTNLAASVRGANTVPKPKEKQSLTKRGVNIGGIVGGTIGVVGAVGAVTLAVGAGVAGGGLAVLVALPFTGGAVLACLAFVGIVIGIGALGGYIHSQVKGSPKEQPSVGPVTADLEAAYQLEQTLDKGVTTKNHVKKGTKIGGIVGGVLGGLGLGGWGVATLVAAGSTTGFLTGTAALGVGFLTFWPVALGALAVAGISVGLGALGGYIHSKRTTQED
jgi:hypothetical protein